MNVLLALEPRFVNAELDEPETDFTEAWDVALQDRGRCLISVIPRVTRICNW